MSPHTILAVEDNPITRKMLRASLESDGYEVREAGDGRAALAAPEVAFEIVRPRRTRRLKADPATSAIVVLALTAYAMKGDMQKALDAGCDGYVTKPIDTRTFPQLIASHLSRPQPPPRTTL